MEKENDNNKVKLNNNGEPIREEMFIKIFGKFPQQQTITNLKKKSIFPKKLKLFEGRMKNDLIYNGSFYEAISPVLVLAQCFALMPVAGVRSTCATYLSFSWKYLRTIYSLFFISCLIIDTFITIYWFLDQEAEISNVDPLIFHILNIIVSISFIKLAKDWPNLMIIWEELEKEILPYYSQMKKRALAYKIHKIILIAVTLSMVEHILNMISLTHYANYCPQSKDIIESFFRTQLSHIFHFFQYNLFLALGGKILNIYMTFVWNYMDAFVMIMSVGLAARFKHMNYNLNKCKGQPMSNDFWGKYRIYYKNTCSLCDKVDNAISIITMASFSSNLYFICVQLLKSLNKMPSFAHGMYFYFSLGFLIGRTIAVSLYAASLHDESKKSIEIFRSVPKESWSSEVKRFANDLNHGLVALSGMKFFYITKKLVLTIAGTIVTYELVLIQFHEDEIPLGC